MGITAIPTTELTGRTVLRTDLTTFTPETLKADLEALLPLHAYNRDQIRQLQEYLRGWHPELQARVKTTRTDVDNKITVDYAWSITRDIVGYFLGKPIQYTHRKGKWRTQMENLVAVLSAENKALVDYQIAEDCSICGVGYRGVLSEPSPRNGTHLKLLRLEPQDTFVVYPTNPLLPPAYAVTSYEMTKPDQTVVTRYTVYTRNTQFDFEDSSNPTLGMSSAGQNLKLIGSRPISFGGNLPIIEYQNNLWRLGDWEMAIPIMDAIDAVTSDGVNDIQQAVNSVLVVLGANMDEAMFQKLSTNGFLCVSDIPAGVRPEIKFISEAMEAEVGLSMREYLEATLRVIVGVPDRKTRGGGGGDTGDAVFMRDGWQDIDLVATAKEPYFIQAEREALATMLYILDVHKEVQKINPTDIEIHFNRNKTANLQSKAQVWQLLLGQPENPGLAPADALDIAGLTNNVSDVILRREKHVENMRKQRIADEVSSTEDADSSEDDASDAGDEGETD